MRGRGSRPDAYPDPDGSAKLAAGAAAVEEQREAVRRMFGRVGSRYDLLNRVLSLGLDRGWRREAVRRMGVGPGGRVLDVACGTGDLALEAARAVPGGLVVGVDFSRPMLERARRKAGCLPSMASPLFIESGAERLPAPDRAFDAAGIAFGIRNIPDRARAIREMARVVRPGGRVVVLELAAPRGGVHAAILGFYLRGVVPLLGALLSTRGPYRYLADSMRAFPRPELFLRELEDAGLVRVSLVPLPPAPAWIVVGVVPE